MRRLVYAVLQTLIHNNIHGRVRRLLQFAAEQQPITCGDEQLDAVAEFAARRLEQLLREKGPPLMPLCTFQEIPHMRLCLYPLVLA
jgi:glycyl-tRNA synthetase beta subunit